MIGTGEQLTDVAKIDPSAGAAGARGDGSIAVKLARTGGAATPSPLAHTIGVVRDRLN